MPSESIHEKLQRVRRPHVHIKYKVDIGDAREVMELPFVVGVMGDFSGDGIGELDDLRDRKFRDINRDNFDDVMKVMKPKVVTAVNNELGGNPEEQLPISLEFNSMDDFTPMGVAKQVPELKALLEKRDKIVQMKTALETNRDTAKGLDAFLKDPKNLESLRGNPPEPPADK
jgi:type VI secretion system protein ImpB